MSALAPIKPYFKYSMDLQQSSPVVAYYLKLHGVNKGFDLIKSNPAAGTPEVKTFLMGELGELEKLKKQLGEGSKEDHAYHVENFVLSYFAKVDKDERTCETVTKLNAVDFKKVSDFIGMLTIFKPLDNEWQEREKYSKFKAGNILKCLKNGEEPQRGNPFAKEEETLPEENGQEEEKGDHPMMSQNTQNSQNFAPTPMPQTLP